MVKILNKENTILNKFLAQMRDKKVQADSMRFRRNMERVAEIMAYEISKRLNYKTRMVELNKIPYFFCNHNDCGE